jgi:hypothetical protein
VDSHKASRNEAILTSVAESIGSTLGTIAAKAGAVQKAFTDKVAEAKPEVRRVAKRANKAAKRATATVKKRVHSRRKRAQKSRTAIGSGRAKRKS